MFWWLTVTYNRKGELYKYLENGNLAVAFWLVGIKEKNKALQSNWVKLNGGLSEFQMS